MGLGLGLGNEYKIVFVIPNPNPIPNPKKCASLSLLKPIRSVICTGFMVSTVLHEQAKKSAKKRPEISSGFTVRVHERIQEGEKERIQVFEGLVISVHKGLTPTDSTITVRRIASGVGVEKVFSLYSSNIEKIDVKKVATVRRAKLFFLRGRRGKSARLSERFTTADEFSIATDVPEPKEEVPTEGITKEAKEKETKEIEETKEKKSSDASDSSDSSESSKKELKAEKELKEESKKDEEKKDA